MTEGNRALSHAVRLSVVGKYLGQLGFVLALLTLMPCFVSLHYGDAGMSLRYALVTGGLLITAWFSRRLPMPVDLQQNEALMIVALAFTLSPLIMSYPMSAAGLSWSDAVFEAISAVTTTGLSTVPDIEQMPPGFIFARAWAQWYGGLGIVVLSLALMHGHHVTSRRLAEPAGSEGLETTTRTFARRTLSIYVLLTLCGIGLLLLVGMGNIDAVVHALSAVSTGGFSPYNDSLGHFTAPWYAIMVVTIGLAGAVPFHLYIRQGHGPALRDPELWLLALLTATVAAVMAGFLNSSGLAWGEAIFHGTVQAISSQSTSGFASLAIDELDDAAKLTLIISMFIGGGLGSTAGGVKLLRLLILLQVLRLLLQRSALPYRAVTAVRLGGHSLEPGEIQAALTLILLFLLVVVCSWLVFLAWGYPPLDALFEVVSASATVGLSSGITSPSLEPPLRLVLCLNMLLGRVEIIAMLILIYPRTWVGKRTEL